MPTTDEGERVRGLATMARALGRSESLLRTLEIAAEEARRALGAASVSVGRLELGTSVVRTLVNVGDLGPHEVPRPTDECYVVDDQPNLVAVVREQRIWTDDLRDPDCLPAARALLLGLGKGCSVMAPIVVDGRVWGGFFATRHLDEPGFAEDESAYLEALTAILAGAVSRCLREESLEQLAYQDPLTGLANRRALDRQAAVAFDVPAGVRRTVTVVSVDINRLKEVNDTRGHVAGDRLIQSVAQALLTAFGPLPGSLVARVGGDEFVVLVSGHDPRDVVAVTDELCRRTWQDGLGATVSCGAAATAVGGPPVAPLDLFAAADRAQYVAKRAGLASTVVAEGFTADLVG